MAEFIGKVGLSSDLSSTPIDEGFLLSTDDGALYLDYKDSDGNKRYNIVPKKVDNVKSVTIEAGPTIKVTTQDGQSEYYQVPTFTAATDAANGTKGLVPAPTAGAANRYLRSDGTWAVPPDTNTTYSVGTTTTAGLTRLYTGTGTNTNGTMTQAAITTALGGKLNSDANAVSATRLANNRTFSITGGATATGVSFNGTGNVALNVTSLDASKLTGTISIDRLPAGALERLVTVENQTARFALTTSDVQLGDSVKQLDTGLMYIVTNTSELDNESGYTEYTAGTAARVEWSGVQNKPSTFTPSTHTHTKSQITDFPSTMKNPTAVKIQLNGGTTEGTNQYTYDGSAAKTINITAAKVGAAESDHSHEIADITNLQTTLNGKLASSSSGYVKSLSISGKTITITKGDNSTSTITTQDTTYSAMGGASSSAAGRTGLVPAPTAGSANRYLRSDGTWAVPPDTNTTYSTGNTTTAGLTRLYTGTGTNTNGTMTQAAITTAINNIQTALTALQEKVDALAIADISGLQDALNGKAASSHTHAIGDVTDLQTTLNGKAASTHTHEIADVTNLQTTLNGKLSTTGTAAAANKLATARTITLGSDCSGSVSFDGSTNVTLNVTVKDDSHNHTIANVDNLQSQLNTISSNANSAKSVTDKYSAMLNIIGNNQ